MAAAGVVVASLWEKTKLIASVCGCEKRGFERVLGLQEIDSDIALGIFILKSGILNSNAALYQNETLYSHFSLALEK